VTGVDINDFSLSTTGSASGTIASISGSGSSYAVTVNSLAGDGALGLNLKTSGTGIADAAGNAIANGGYTGQTYTLDHTLPAVSSIVRASATPTNATSLSYTVTFSESVTGVDSSDFSFTTSGSAAGAIASVSGSGATYTVNVNSVSGTGTLRLDLKASGTGIVDVASNAIAGGYTSGQLYTLDNTAPAVSSVSVPADATYRAGQTLSFTVNFNEAVTVDTTGGTPRIALTLDSGSVFATYASGSGSNALTFSYTVASNNLDVNGITIGALSANGGTLRDAVGNNATLTLNSVATTAGVLVDGVAPSVSSINRVGASTSSANSVDYTVTFSENVSGVDIGDFQLTTTGTSAGTVSAISGSGNVYTVTVSSVSGDGTLRLDLKNSGTGITDAAGNAIAAGYTAGQAYTLDHTGPAIGSVSVPASATYRSGQQLDFTVNFNEAVTVDSTGGTPALALTLDTGGTVQAQYVSGSGTTALVFRHIVTSGQADADGVTIGALQLNGATLRDSASNNASLALNGVAGTGGVLVDAIAPTVVSIDRAGAATTNAGSVSYVVTFSENISGASTGSFVLSTTGNAAGTIDSVSGSGSSYTVTVNSVTGDGSLRLDLKASGTGITDTAGNVIAAGGYTSGQAYTLDHTAPTVASVSVPSNATYNSGASLDFTVNFSEAVTVDTTGGTPRIAVTLDGPTTVYASYVSGSGGTALVFRYIVQQGDTDGDGISLNAAIDLHGGTLKDSAGNNATPTLSAVGALNGVLVDATGASVSSIVPASSAPTNGASMVYTVTFSGAVTGVDASDFSLTPSGVGSTASGVIGAVTQVSPSVYTVTVNSLAGDGGLRLDLKASGTGIVDAGNSAAVAGYTGGQAAVIDHTGPQVTAVAAPAAATYASGAALDFTVSFNEAVNVGGAPTIALTLDGGAVVQAQYVSGSGSSALVFRYVVAASDYDADGVSVGTAIALAGGSLQDSAGNNATLALNGVASSAAVLISGAGPAISSIVPNTTPSSGSSVAYTVTFSRDVSGVDSADFALHATGTAAGTVASVAAVPGSNRAYVVTVNGVSGDGTLRLDLAASGTGITDTLGHVITAGGYTAGQPATVDHTAPTATVVLGSSSLSVGQTAVLTVTFSEAVTQFTNADLTVGSGSVGTLSSGDGGITWTGVFTPAAGVQANANVITLNTTTLTDLAGNAGTLSIPSNTYSVDTVPVVVTPPVTPPVTSLPTTPGVSTVDGVTLLTSVSVDPVTGRNVSTVVIPVITQTRPDDPGTPNASLADIPLGLTTNGVTAGLTVSLPVGSGLQVEGSTSLLTQSDGLLDLIRRIEQKTVAGSSVQSEMTGTGTDFLSNLFSGVLLQSMTITPTVTASAGTATTILITGSSTTPAAGTNNASAIGLVIDAQQLSANTVLQLNNVDFAAVVGAATLRGGDGQNIVIGDGAAQNILLGADDDQLFGGAGDDVIGSAGGDDLLDGGSGNDIVVGGIGNDTLRGGTGNDVLQGGRSDSGAWTFMLGANGQLTARHQTALFAPTASETLAAAELDAARPELGFLGAAPAKLLQLAGLYQAAFGRVADVSGLTFWTSKTDSLLDMAKGFMISPEWVAAGYDQLDDRGFVEMLYQKALGRGAEAGGVTFWLDALSGANGMALHSRAEVLLGFALSAELQANLAQNGSVTVAAASLAQESGWIGGSGNDRLEGGAGSDILVGGDGVDTIVYSGRQSDYRIELASDGRVLVADKANSDVDTIRGIELGAFADGTVNLGFTQASTAQLKAVGLLYQAVLDRAGDLPGFAFWIDHQLSVAQLVTGFTHSEEFKARYDDVSNAQFVASLYQNSGIASDAAGGQGAWVSYLDTHTREEMVARWIDTEVVGQAQFAGDGLWLV
ncbi:MAG: Ig-like domain-containing protein, partial [Duganella sp.]